MSQEFLSKIAVGTVQFGMDYGIFNSLGKTPSAQVRVILRAAKELGVDTLDTAHLYGGSELAIGHTGFSREFKIVTKTQYFNGEIIEDSHVNELQSTFFESVKKLDCNPYALLLHNAGDALKPGGCKLFAALDRLKNDGLVEKIGVSVYSPSQIESILEKFSVDLIQIPLNIYDQRFLKSGLLGKLKAHNVEVHVRSIFLQGLLLMKDLPDRFQEAHQEAHNTFVSYCADMGKSALNVALMFVQGLPEIDRMVVGVNTLEQLLEISRCESFSLQRESTDQFAMDDETFINPSNWVG